MEENSKKSTKFQFLKSVSFVLIGIALILFAFTKGNLSQTSTDSGQEDGYFIGDSSSSIISSWSGSNKSRSSEKELRNQGSSVISDMSVTESAYMKSDMSNNMVKSISFHEPSFKKPKGLPINNEIEVTENSVKLVSEEPISTFSADVDDGSYKLFKREAQSNNDIHPSIIRVEEFVNAFQYDSYKKAESQEKPFSTDIKIMESPWSDNYLMLVGIKGDEYKINNLPPVNLTLVVEVAGSMS